jgi:hypothetical protein
MTPAEAIVAIQKLTEETVAELKRLNAEEQAIYDRVFKQLEEVKIERLEKEIAGEG